MAAINTRWVGVRLSPNYRLLSASEAQQVSQAAFLLELIAFGETQARAAWPHAGQDLMRSNAALDATVRRFQDYFRSRNVRATLDANFLRFTGNTFTDVWAEVTLCATDRPVHGLATQGRRYLAVNPKSPYFVNFPAPSYWSEEKVARNSVLGLARMVRVMIHECAHCAGVGGGPEHWKASWPVAAIGLGRLDDKLVGACQSSVGGGPEVTCELAIAEFERQAPPGRQGAITSLLSKDLEDHLEP